jgi:hypothetical protein
VRETIPHRATIRVRRQPPPAAREPADQRFCDAAVQDLLRLADGADEPPAPLAW